MEPETVYNPTTITSHGNRSHYLDNISYASLNPKRCANVAIVVVGVMCVMIGLALVLYGSLFYVSFATAPEAETSAQRERRLSELHMYQVFVWVGAPLLAAGVLLWIAYLYRTGRCKYCPLCPGARKRRRLRKNFQTQCLEAGNLSSSYASQPASALPQREDDQLMNHSLDEPTGLEDTDAMLSSSTRPILRPMQTSI
ncbi:uncharacterized protein LOC119114295 isoform X2 [Pollicipes pollicipes]|uniref:uncharacterized protein LOC119114295 isoform X2 n=1 Tax=Pollicipes pollicipes TaxID=41117 RepID=UPI0018854188|nr:uncharacterized protein LOC119114295 isoform X2 [Pollicipes pollicipes]